MENTLCSSCQKSNGQLTCGLCASQICKYCAQILDEDNFSFLPQIPAELAHTTYCATCFDGKIASALASYNQTMELAKQVQVLTKKQGKESRLIKRTEKPIKVLNCIDQDETLLRLAFLAAQMGYNSIVDVDVTSQKVRQGSYQTQKWHGCAIPANLKSEHIVKDRSLWQNPN